MKVKLNLDTQRLKEKPKVFDGRLRTRLCSASSIREVTPEELMQAIQEGRTFTPAVMTGTTGDTWQEQQVICADIDNDSGKKDADGNKIMIDRPLTPDEAADTMREYGIDPAFMYYSFSNKTEWPKYRIVLILDAPIKEKAAALDLEARFTGIFNKARPLCADKSNSDSARLYYGGRSGSVFYCSGQTTAAALLQALPEPPETPAEELKRPKIAPKPQTAQKITLAPKKAGKRTFEELQAQLREDIETFDLAGYVMATTPSRPVMRGRSLFFNPCPICGHNDDFQVTGSLYHCYNTTSPKGGTGGTIIDYLMNHHEISDAEALEKFKFEIMRYDRDEWKRAYKEMKRAEEAAERRAAFTGPQVEIDPAAYEMTEEEIQAALDAEAAEWNEYIQTPEGQAEQAEVDAYWAASGADPGQQQAEEAGKAGEKTPPTPAGLLTAERARQILETADETFFDLPHFPKLAKTAKLRKHDTVVLAADTGAGKSSLALNFLHELNDRHPVMYFNLEMDESTILQRLIAIHTGIELDVIEGYKQDEKTREKVNAAIDELTARQEIRLLNDAYGLEEIEEQIKAATAGREVPTVVFIDTGLLVKAGAKSASRYERFTLVSEEMRRISRQNNVILFVLLQMNREGKATQNRPTNSSLKESGSWENDATKIMFLWADPKEPKDRKELLLTKNRSGKLGDFTVNYAPHTQTYSEPSGTAGTADAPEDEPRNEWQQADFSDISAAF